MQVIGEVARDHHFDSDPAARTAGRFLVVRLFISPKDLLAARSRKAASRRGGKKIIYDVNAAASHITLRYTMMEDAGRVAFGLRPRSPLF
jgi:hypothetical protein